MEDRNECSQDVFANAQAGTSRQVRDRKTRSFYDYTHASQVFRTQRSTAPGLEHDASQFFSADTRQPTISSPPATPFNLSEFRNALPLLHAATPPIVQSPSPQIVSAAQTAGSWAAEFLVQQPQSQSPAQFSSNQEALQLSRPVVPHASSYNPNFHREID